MNEVDEFFEANEERDERVREIIRDFTKRVATIHRDYMERVRDLYSDARAQLRAAGVDDDGIRALIGDQ